MAETRKERNIRNETQRRINAGDTSSYVQSQISSKPNTFTNVQPNQRKEQQEQQYQAMADTMEEAGIRSLSGRTTDDSDGKGSFDKGEKARDIQKYFLQEATPKSTPYEEQLYDLRFGRFSDVPPEGILTETAGDPLKQSISGTDTSGSDQGTDSSSKGDEGEGIDDIILKVLTGEEIKQLSPERLKRTKSVLSQYISLGETNPLKLRALMTSNIAGGIFGKDQTVSDMEGKIVKPEDAFNPDGTLKEGLRYTKEGIIKLLDEDQEGGNILESLKKFNPELYYPFIGMPATSGSLVDLAKIPVTEEMQGTNPELAKMIFNARATLDQNKGNQGGGGAGIPSLATATTPFTDVNNNGILDNLETAQATTTPVTGLSSLTPTTPVTGVSSSTPTTINYASMAPQFGGYVNQGINDPRFAQYYQNLSDYYGYNA